MQPTNAVDAINYLIQNIEGTGTVANDAGKGLTKFGINQMANPDIDVANLTPELAHQVYKQRYWDAIGADSLPENMRMAAFDTAVNFGPGTAKKWLAQAGNDPAILDSLRREKHAGLVAANPAKYGEYAKGWESRDDLIAGNGADTLMGGGDVDYDSMTPEQLLAEAAKYEDGGASEATGEPSEPDYNAMTPEQLKAEAAKYVDDVPATAAPTKADAKPSSVLDDLQRALGRTGRMTVGGLGSLADPFAMVINSTADLAHTAGRKGLEALGVDFGNVPYSQGMKLPSEGLKAIYDQATGGEYAPQTTGENVTDFLGEMLAGGGASTGLSKAAGLTDDALKYGANTVENLVQRMGQIAPQPVKAAKEAVSEVGDVGADALSRMVDADPEKAALAKTAMEKFNIPLAGSQVTNSKATKGFASTISKIPLSGAGRFEKKQQSAFTRAVSNTFGEDADRLTPQVMSAAKNRLGKVYDELFKGEVIPVQEDMYGKVNEILSKAESQLTPDFYQVVKNQVDQFVKSIDADGTIKGEKLNSLRKTLGEMLGRKGNDATPFIGELRSTIIDNALMKDPVKKALLEKTNGQYKNLLIVKPLAAKSADTSHRIRPSLLLNRVISKNPNFAMGQGGDLAELANIGQAFVKDPIPDSGTATRALNLSALFGAGGGAAMLGVLPQVATGIGTAAAYNAKNTAQPLVRRAVERSLRKGIPGL